MIITQQDKIMGKLDLLQQGQLENIITERLQLTLDNIKFDHDFALNAIFNTFKTEDQNQVKDLVKDIKGKIESLKSKYSKEEAKSLSLSLESVFIIISKYLNFTKENGESYRKGNALESVISFIERDRMGSDFTLDCKLPTLFLIWLLKENKIDCSLVVRFSNKQQEDFSNTLAHPSVFLPIAENLNPVVQNFTLKAYKIDFILKEPYFNIQPYINITDVQSFILSTSSIQEAFIVLDILYTIGSSLVDASKEINSKLDQENILNAIIYFFSKNLNPEIVNAFKSNQDLIQRFIENVVTVLNSAL